MLAADRFADNAALIAQVAALGYFRDDDKVLDCTYGRGIWWRTFRPEGLVCSDIDPTIGGEVEVSDFRYLYWNDDAFDVVAFDPPYAARGGPSTMVDYNERYGRTCSSTPEGVQAVIDAGLDECLRVVKPRGYVLVKCANYVWSGSLWLGAHHTLTHALSLGFDVCEQFIYLGCKRPQPDRTRKDGKPSVQVHARSNYSILYVLRAPKKGMT